MSDKQIEIIKHAETKKRKDNKIPIISFILDNGCFLLYKHIETYNRPELLSTHKIAIKNQFYGDHIGTFLEPPYQLVLGTHMRAAQHAALWFPSGMKHATFHIKGLDHATHTVLDIGANLCRITYLQTTPEHQIHRCGISLYDSGRFNPQTEEKTRALCMARRAFNIFPIQLGSEAYCIFEGVLYGDTENSTPEPTAHSWIGHMDSEYILFPPFSFFKNDPKLISPNGHEYAQLLSTQHNNCHVIEIRNSPNNATFTVLLDLGITDIVCQ